MLTITFGNTPKRKIDFRPDHLLQTEAGVKPAAEVKVGELVTALGRVTEIERVAA